MSEEAQNQSFDSWCVLELFGHKKLAGRVTEQVIGGAALLRIDVPEGEGYSTHYYGNAAVYGLHPVTEEVARLFAQRYKVEPVSRWELPATTAAYGDEDEAVIHHYASPDDDDDF